jgi:hypothetical protein
VKDTHDQLRMWDETPTEVALGQVTSHGLTWNVALEVRECADRFYRGRLVFRNEGRQLRTADIFVAQTADEVVDRAKRFEEHLIRQLVESLA